MTDRTDDILSLLDEVHGDGLSRREAAVNDAVGQIERSAYRGYSALRDLAQHGTARPVPQPTMKSAHTESPSAPPVEPPTAEATSPSEVTAMIAAPMPQNEPVSEASEAETRIGTPPPKPEKPRNSEPVDVVSGDGASFRERGHTQTHIIRRPKNWFGRR